MGEFVSAKELATSLLVNYRSSLRLLNIIGSVYLQLNNATEAEKFFKEALVLSPNSSVTNYNLGYLYYKNKNYDAAKLCLLNAIQARHDYVEAMRLLAAIYCETSYYEDAEVLYRELLDSGTGNHWDIKVGLCKALMGMERYDDAVEAVSVYL